MFELPENIRQGLLNYLSTKPYIEVAEIIDALVRLRFIPNTNDN